MYKRLVTDLAVLFCLHNVTTLGSMSSAVQKEAGHLKSYARPRSTHFLDACNTSHTLPLKHDDIRSCMTKGAALD